ncbi:glycosyltransferase [[Erwinia] mediterraneensis]|uniref:glycosyltransferase n=1 Tax=[Erwinia] mediterraneensis TaxID=2161819 RepID=UPI0010327BDB|nr:glycosyltransferase [[Erwinia] mediterraneensis]
MKIIFIITGMGIGGAEKQLSLLASKMSSRGHNVLIISLSANIEVDIDSNIGIEVLDMNKNPLSLICALSKASRIINKFKPDIVHSHMFHANIFARILRVFNPFPVLISTSHSTFEGGKLRMLAYRITQNIPDISTNVSPDAVAAFIKKKAASSGKMITVYNGIDTDKFRYSLISRNELRKEWSIDSETKIILSVGRLVVSKDYPNLIKAYKYLIQKNLLKSNSKLVIVGSGPLESSLKKLVDSYELKNHVLFLGARNDIEKIFSTADLFVLASQWEGFGLVVAEAMACERIVVATNSGGVKNVIGRFGSLVPIKKPVMLAEAISDIFKMSDEERCIQASDGRQWIENAFSIEKIVDEWINIYKKQIEKSN